MVGDETAIGDEDACEATAAGLLLGTEVDGEPLGDGEPLLEPLSEGDGLGDELGDGEVVGLALDERV